MAGALLSICRRPQSLFFTEKPSVIQCAIHTWVWWDMNSAQIPVGWDPSCIAGRVTDSLGKLNYSAPVTFSDYVDGTLFVEDEDVHALSSTAIKLFQDAYFTRKKPDLASKQILQDLRLWAEDHPAPANCLFITGDRHLLPSLQRPMKGYNILLARPKELGEMEAEAKTVWRWRCLLAGYPPESTN